jgi:hypothetical protein
LTKAQRKAQHVEEQRRIWDGAEDLGRSHWLKAQGVPFSQEFKPPLTVLSRNPAPVLAKRDNSNGISNLKIDGEDDSEEESRKKREADLEERQRRAKIEREEKQRKYAEARERIMGTSKPSSPATVSRESSSGRDNRKAKPRINNSNRNSQPTSSADQSPARPINGEKQLFDPDDMGRRLLKRDSNTATRQDQPVRQPRGPNDGGSSGFGFGA